MANHNSLESLFSDIANAIRAKTGGTGIIVADDFPAAIAAIQTKDKNVLLEPAMARGDMNTLYATFNGAALADGAYLFEGIWKSQFKTSPNFNRYHAVQIVFTVRGGVPATTVGDHDYIYADSATSATAVGLGQAYYTQGSLVLYSTVDSFCADSITPLRSEVRKLYGI